jgi:LysM repeat protein
MKRFFLFATLMGCSFLSAKPSSGYYSPEMDELRIELEDVKRELHSTQVELSLLEERQKKQAGAASKQVADSSMPLQVSSLEKKLSNIEKNLEKLTADLRVVTTHLNQTVSQVEKLESSLVHYDDKFSELGKLKGTLTSISKAMQQPQPVLDAKTYRVKAGDSLEKIARLHHTTAQALRKLNQLSSDKIVVGQQLQVGDE